MWAVSSGCVPSRRLKGREGRQTFTVETEHSGRAESRDQGESQLSGRGQNALALLGILQSWQAGFRRDGSVLLIHGRCNVSSKAGGFIPTKGKLAAGSSPYGSLLKATWVSSQHGGWVSVMTVHTRKAEAWAWWVQNQPRLYNMFWCRLHCTARSYIKKNNNNNRLGNDGTCPQAFILGLRRQRQIRSM